MSKQSNSDTSWGGVAGWYSEHLEQNLDTYQRQVILPNLLRLLDLKKTDKVLDLACGSGFFSRELAQAGAQVTGVDISAELIKLARENSKDFNNLEYFVANADKLANLENNYFDKIICVLALQNIEKVKEVFAEVKRALKKNGKLYLVLNHPAFRVPGESSWGWDEASKTQYRRLDQYLSEKKVEIQMHPGADPDSKTLSFHRPMQYYFKLLSSAGLAITRLEEWISHKTSQPGPRQKAEDRARHEFPLFLYLEAAVL